MKTIGFVDFYISEWHANNYPAWIKEANENLGLDYQLGFVWAEQDVSPVDGVNTDQWCEKFGAVHCATIAELCEKSDVVLILAPSNPEKHIGYAREVLPFGKPTYIDKPFSDTVEDAREIFAIAEKHGTPFFSTSALRYASDLDEVGECAAVSVLGGGSSLEEYIIHQAEMVVKKLGIGAESVSADQIGNQQYLLTICYPDGRKAMMHYAEGAPFNIIMTPVDGKPLYKAVSSGYFQALLRDVLSFFESGKPGFCPEETLEVNRIMVAAIKAKNCLNTVIPV